MRNLFTCLLSLLLILAFVGQSFAQQTPAAPAASGTSASLVPRLIKFSGVLLDRQGQPLKGPVGVTFSLYAQQSGDAPLWMETQSVELDAKGVYTVLLGTNNAAGLPEEMFRSGEARWLGVQLERETELPRVLLVSVPYALKAGDAQTLGGLPPSAFAPANFSAPANAPSPSSTLGVLLVAPVGPPEAGTTGGSATAPTGGGTTNFIPLWTSSTNLGNSILFQSTTSNVNVNGSLSLPALKAATALAGANSQPLDLLSSAFSSSTHLGISQHFRWQAEPVGNNTTTPSGKLNLLYAAGTGAPAETGLSINNKGQITFASGQTFPTVTGNETVTGNVSANQLQSSVATGTAPLVVKSTTQVANLNASLLGGMPASSFATRGANLFSGFQSIAGNGLSMYIGDVACSAGSVGIQAQAFSFGCGNFAMLLDTGGNTVINRPSGGNISFREGNGSDQLTIMPSGQISIGTPGGQISLGTSVQIFPDGDVEIGPGRNFAVAQLAVIGNINVNNGDAIIGVGADSTNRMFNAGFGLGASGGNATAPGTFGGVGIDAAGGKNSDGTLARAANFHGDVAVDGCISASTVIIGGSCQSDARFKKNIQPYSPVLDKLVRLQPITYNWRVQEYPQYRFGTEKSSGLIAQEVEKVFPEMVSVDQAGFKRVNYGELPLLMLQAIRELHAENIKLQEEMKAREAQWEERVREQEQRVNLQQMQRQMAALEARLARVEGEGGSNQAGAATGEVPNRKAPSTPTQAQTASVSTSTAHSSPLK